MKAFKGKVAVITGAASGIGKALTKKCLAEGMYVVMADIEESALAAASEELSQAGQNSIVTVKTDVAIKEEIEHLARIAQAEFGAVHILFNNAGVGGGGSTWEATQKDWEWVLGVNLWSVIYGVKTFVPIMIAQDTECHIVNTASVAGLLGGSTNACYSVTKHGVVALTENLFNDLNEQSLKIGTSVLCPGFVNTNIHDSSRNRPEDLKEAQQKEPSTEQKAMFKAFLEQGMNPDKLADIVFEGIRQNRLYILTHTDFNEAIRNRAENIVSGINPEPISLTCD